MMHQRKPENQSVASDVAMTLLIGALGGLLYLAGFFLVPTQGDVTQFWQQLTLDQLMGLTCASAGLLLSLWWMVALLAAILAELSKAMGLVRFNAMTTKISPAYMRRLAALIFSLNLLAAPAALAHQSDGPLDPKWAGTGASSSQEQTPMASEMPSTSAVVDYPSPSAIPSPASSEKSLSSAIPTSPSMQPTIATPSYGTNPLWTPQAPVIEPGPLAPQLRRLPPVFPSSPKTPIAAISKAVSPSPANILPAHPVHPVHSSPETSRTDQQTSEGSRNTMVVLRGDSLWSIAARTLGHAANDFEIAMTWPRWYAANRQVIGEDPNYLLPGQVLVIPR